MDNPQPSSKQSNSDFDCMNAVHRLNVGGFFFFFWRKKNLRYSRILYENVGDREYNLFIDTILLKIPSQTTGLLGGYTLDHVYMSNRPLHRDKGTGNTPGSSCDHCWAEGFLLLGVLDWNIYFHHTGEIDVPELA